MNEPWYKDGLRFQCTQCGNCCTGAPGYVWVNKEEIEQMAKLVGLAVPEFEAKFVRLVGVRKSLIEAWQQTCEVCPGSGKGKLYSLDHIRTTLAIVKV
jgi:hypothetical protein